MEFFYNPPSPAKSTYMLTWVKAPSLPCCLSACHVWDAKITDRRRRHFVRGDCLDAVCVTAQLLSDREAEQSAWAFLSVSVGPASLEDGAASAPMGMAEQSIALNTRFANGWRLSYKLQTPETESAGVAGRRLQRKVDRMGFLQGDAQGQRHRDAEQIKASSDLTAERLRAKRARNKP